jgi:hypothetical protein
MVLRFINALALITYVPRISGVPPRAVELTKLHGLGAKFTISG